MKKLIISLMTVFFFCSGLPLIAGEVPTMNKDELKSLLGSNNLVLLDVRQGRDWSSSEFIIPGAVRAKADDFDTWSATLPKDKKIVLYCA